MPFLRHLAVRALAALALVTATNGIAAAQQATGTVVGRVTNAADGSALPGISISVRGTALGTATGSDGRYTLRNVPAGSQTIVFRWLGYKPVEKTVTVTAGGTVTTDAALENAPLTLSEIVVSGASRAPEKVTEAPAAITQVDPQILQGAAATGQAPLALSAVPGVDIVQNGVNDFNVNTRGFNSSLNRRVLTLQDGRDLAVAFLGSQEWYALTQPLDDVGRLEMVRGPGSALYGANAFSGVINITTPTARETLGGKISMSAGELRSFRVDGRYGVEIGTRSALRLAGGVSRSDTWARSRTDTTAAALQREFGDQLFVPNSLAERTRMGLQPEVRALNGQTISTAAGANRAAIGDRAPLRTAYGALRFDTYFANGGIFTLDGGASVNENETLLTGIGRVQVTKTFRPWARANYSADKFTVSAWYNGRNALEPQFSLRSGAALEENSTIGQLESQYNTGFGGGKGKVIIGGAYRRTLVNTEGTLMQLSDDDRSDWTASAYSQLEYKVSPQLKLVAASRVDDGNLFRAQISPKGAIVFSPNDRHSFRGTYNRAFQTPNYSEFFLRVDAGAPTTAPRTLETSLEGYFAAVRANAPTALAGLNAPTDIPWNFSASTRALALGNRNLDVETVDGFEIGYKGEISDKFYVTADGYVNKLKNFVTDLIPGVNPEYPSFGLGDQFDIVSLLNTVNARLTAAGLPANHPLRAPIPALLGGYGQLVTGTTIGGRNALATLPDGTRAIVLSYTNAGRVTERGVELGAGYRLTNNLKIDGSLTFFDFTVNDQLAGDQLLPNTPNKKGSLQVSYADGTTDAQMTVRIQDGMPWAAGVYQGYVQAMELVDASAGYRPLPYLRLYASATNVLNQRRYQAFGGAVIGRRVLAGVSTTF